MDQDREVLRDHRYSYRIEQLHCQWILRYIRYFGGKSLPERFGAKDIETFFLHLPTKGEVTAST